MLKARVITALVLLVVLLPALFLGSPEVIHLLCMVFFAAACWESHRLFWDRFAIPTTMLLTALFALLTHPSLFQFPGRSLLSIGMVMLGCLAWTVMFVPALKCGLPKRQGVFNTLFGVAYLISVAACFIAIVVALDWGVGSRADYAASSSPTVWGLLSVMLIVWVADIGAYFSGKAVGRHSLAPAISPGKSWEGAIGGWLCVLVAGAVGAQFPVSFMFFLKQQVGWPGLLVTLSFLTVVSVTGDLIESQLKRRAQVKDSSQLLPGHGGVLDRIDALIFVMPMALLCFVII